LRPELIYYLVESLLSASPAFIASVYVIFLLESGLDYRGVALVDGFYVVTSALLDFPTGGLADKYGRGKIASLGCLLVGMGLLSYSLSSTLPEFLFSEFLAALGTALYSGALLSWLVDSLREEGRGEELAPVLGKAGTISWLGSVVAAFVGGVLAEVDLHVPFAAGAVTAIAACAVAARYTRGRGESPSPGQRSYLGFLKGGASALFSSRPLIWLTAAGALSALGHPCFTLTWAPHMESLGATKWMLGAASSVLMATVGFSQYAGGRLAARLGYKRIAVLSTLAMSASFALMTAAYEPAIFLLAALPFELGLGLRTPAVGAWINEFIPSEERATVVSLRRTLLLPFSASGMAIMGFLSDLGTPRLAFKFGMAALAFSSWAYYAVPEPKHPTDHED